jgi:MFS family permease
VPRHQLLGLYRDALRGVFSHPGCPTRPWVLLLFDGCHKAIPTTVERLDAALRLSTIANRFAHRYQTRIQGPIGDELMEPQMLQEFILVIAGGCVLRMAGFLLFAFSDALSSVLLAVLLSGLGGALFGPAVRAYLASESGERRVEAFALFQICEGMGACLGSVLGVVLFQISFPLVCVIASVIFLV